MIGYRADFLGVELPLPAFSPALIGDVLQTDALARSDQGLAALAHYPNYTVAMSRVERTALFAALNIDQSKLRRADGRSWRIDQRIGAEHQLNNDYYRGATNLYDRGHLARRASAAWGDTARAAQRASEETYYYANAALQHRYFNEDEWLELENWVKDLGIDSTDRVSVFSGPIFGDFSRTIQPAGRPRAVIPSAFFKVVAFINEAGVLEVRSFIVVQDAEAIADRDGDEAIDREDAAAAEALGVSRDMVAFQRYQVTVTEIEARTGLVFPDVIPARNPLLYTVRNDTAAERGITHAPERYEVDHAGEVINSETEPRTPVCDDAVPVYIAAAMVNPEGADRAGEWVSIVNLGGADVDLEGWTLSDTRRPPLALTGALPAGGALRLGPPLERLQLGNRGGVLVLKNAAGERIDRVRYAADEVRTGETVRFTRERHRRIAV